jgi:hypothetical protein
MPTPIPAEAPVDSPPEDEDGAGPSDGVVVGVEVADAEVAPLVLLIVVEVGMEVELEDDVAGPRWIGIKLNLRLFAPYPAVVFGLRSNQHGVSSPEKSNEISADELYGPTRSSLFSVCPISKAFSLSMEDTNLGAACSLNSL